MKLVQVNQAALAAALDFVMGAQARMATENLYEILNTAETRGHEGGFEVGFQAAQKIADIADRQGFSEGYEFGYDAGLDAATSDEQPSTDEFYEVYEDFEDFEDAFYEVYYNMGDGAVEVPDEAYAVDELPPMQEQRSAVQDAARRAKTAAEFQAGKAQGFGFSVPSTPFSERFA